MTCEHNMRKMKLSRILLPLVLFLSFAGCTKLVKAEYKPVAVTIVDADMTPAYTETRYDVDDNRVKIIEHPAYYVVTVEYEGEKHYLYDEMYYLMYYDKIGEQVQATAKVKTYEDGKTKVEIVALKGWGE